MSFRIKPIRNEEDYNASLEYLNEIFDAEKGTQEADEKEIISILIENYEDNNFFINMPDPIEAIKFRMSQEGLSQKDLIPLIGTRSKVSEILSGKRSLTLKMIRALNTHIGIPAEVLLQDTSYADLSELKDLQFEKFPIIEMQKLNAFEGFNIDNLRDKSEEAIRFLIEKIGGLDSIPEALFRKSESPRLNAKVDLYALQAWCLIVLSKAKDEKKVGDYIQTNIRKKQFLNNLVSLSVLSDGPYHAKEYLARYGIILKIVPHLKNTYLDGGSFITKDGRPVIGLTLRYDRIDNFWFTLLHEIGHIKMHLSVGNYIVDDMTLRDTDDVSQKEFEADKFAEEALLPTSFNLHKKDSISKEDVKDYALSHNVHPAIVAGRIQHKKIIINCFLILLEEVLLETVLLINKLQMAIWSLFKYRSNSGHISVDQHLTFYITINN